MQVRILLFGVLKDLLPDQPDSICLEAGSTVDDLLQTMQARFAQYFTQTGPAAQGNLWSSIAVAVNREYAPATHRLNEGDEVALLPPVSGGTENPHVALIREPIDTTAVVAALKQGEDGAIVTFDGIVRNNTRRRRTLWLVYEAYEEMALPRMQRLAAEARAKYPIRDVAIVHRLGHLEIGETSVFIAVASAHRAAAFDACRWLIDTLKKTVPIWKKEHFEDGAVWSDGEPFPAELTPQVHPKPSPEPLR
ncbi:molybdenum cofactor biosynthesis protein [Paracidobacterium acidisoli]|uniref:Molybdopterin synthase catalytic subunit n=1 Tax=Paracidobacterium acidisoli TaxID=2303751 RepID=A0A372ISS5_9BACT|nr:molybdenum cofactor biosynthesis protein MoaE [Paracidobacterium acidisoli]MBT9330520.1 molybdenum cofactor biosynthesis protein MoaE [Paracidobacterium acidisoli]